MDVSSKVKGLIDGILKPSELSKEELDEAIKAVERKSKEELQQKGILVEEMKLEKNPDTGRIYYIIGDRRFRFSLIGGTATIVLTISVFVIIFLLIIANSKIKLIRKELGDLELSLYNISTNVVSMDKAVERRTKNVLDTMEYIEDVIYKNKGGG